MAPMLRSRFTLPPPVPTNEPFFPFDTELTSPSTAPGSPMERSIRSVMTKYGTDTDVRGSYLLPSYRCLRRLRPLEDNQAVAVSHDANTYKINVDVHDFRDGSISVRAVGDHELVVEGLVESKSESQPNSNFKTSQSSSRKFQQRVMFPDLQVEGVTSTISTDGVLTIVAPRKSTKNASAEFKIPIESVNKTSSQDIKENSTTEVKKEIQIKSEQSKENIVPIQMEKEVQIKNQESLGSSISVNNKDRLVPIHKKGSFFQDSFFETSREPLQQAIDNIKKQMEETMKLEDPFKWYSNVRCSDSMEDSRAGTITTEGDSYKIVLEVKDFQDGSLVIKSSGENVILVEGKLDRKTDNSTTMRRFHRRFVLPGHIKTELVTSALSSEGILTIVAPKKEEHFRITDITNEEKELKATESLMSPVSDLSGPFSPVYSHDSESKPNFEQTSSTAESNSVTSQTETRTQETSVKSANTVQIPITTVGSSTVTQTGEKNIDINYIDKSHSEIERAAESQSQAKKFELIGSVKDLTDCNIKETVKQRKSVSGPTPDRDIPISVSGSKLPIVRRGPFFQDSFFTDFQKNYQVAVRNILDQWFNVFDSHNSVFHNTSKSFDWFDHFDNTLCNYRSILPADAFEDLTCYKSLTNRNFREENQARSFIETKEDFKIVLDVHGFSEQDLKIQAANTNEIIVEGHFEDNKPGSRNLRSFKKHFVLPGRVRIDAVTSALSADHVLTITVPKNTALSITA